MLETDNRILTSNYVTMETLRLIQTRIESYNMGEVKSTKGSDL